MTVKTPLPSTQACILLPLICLVLSTASIAQEDRSNWQLVEENVLGARQDIYVDTNSREQGPLGSYLVRTLTDNRGRSQPVEMISEDISGNLVSTFLRDKLYKSIVKLKVYDCARNLEGRSFTVYKAEAMARGTTVYEESDGGQGVFIPFSWEEKIRDYACTGKF